MQVVAWDPEGGMCPIRCREKSSHSIRPTSHIRMLSAKELDQKRSRIKGSSDEVLL